MFYYLKAFLLAQLILLLAQDNNYGQSQPQYSLSGIPALLLENTNAIVRFEKGVFYITAEDRATFKFHKVITILNEKADRYAFVSFRYDKYLRPKSFTALIYNAKGEEVGRMKKKHINDESSITGPTLYSDNRVKWADLRQKEYPYTVEYTYELEYKYLYSIPNWNVISEENISVQNSEYIVSAPTDLSPRYRQYNVAAEPEVSSEKERTTYQWKFKNIPALEIEPFSKGFRDVAPRVSVAPSKFNYNGYAGDMSTWDGLAAWQNSLNQGREKLAHETINKIKTLTKNLKSDKEKIKVVYEYMQSRTRYVSVQLGIGGFQPFKASVVDKVGYGDCKALSFYTQSLLKVAGIKSHYTWVDAGPNPREIVRGFPDDTFNHIILCVPNNGDTVWLECTSQRIPFGYLGKFTSDRDVLLITDKGGEIVHTPRYEYENNQILTNGEVRVFSNGNAEAYINTKFIGLSYEYGDIDYYMSLSESEQKNWIHRNVHIANYELDGHKYSKKKNIIPTSNLELNLGLRQVFSGSSKRQFLAPNIINEVDYVPSSDTARASPIYIEDSPMTYDTIHFTIPDQLRIDHLPEKQTITCDFGEYSAETTAHEKGITHIRYMKLNKGKYPADKYGELVNFLKKVRRADKKKVVLMNGK